MGGTAGPLIKFFKQSGCIVIHKCERVLAYVRRWWRVLNRLLTPRCFRQALRSDTPRQARTCDAASSPAPILTPILFNLVCRENGC
jgi:hypothetical protein